MEIVATMDPCEMFTIQRFEAEVRSFDDNLLDLECTPTTDERERETHAHPLKHAYRCLASDGMNTT